MTVYDMLDSYKEDLFSLADRLQRCPERGYEEIETIETWRQFAAVHGMSFDTTLGGKAPVVTCGDFSKATTRVVITSDLDAVGVPRETDLAWSHLCGHHAQSVHSLGIGLLAKEGLFPSGVAIRLVGCPAEECQPAYDPAYPLPFLTGKQRLLKEGTFTGANAVLGTHLADDLPDRAVILAHGAPGGIWIRIDADTYLHALSYIDRQTSLRNARIERLARRVLGVYASSIRMKSTDRCLDLRIATRCVDDTWPPSGVAVVEELCSQGFSARLVAQYAPLSQSANLLRRAALLLKRGDPPVNVLDALWLKGVTDLGDVSAVAPTLQIFVGGTSGMTHDPRFFVTDQWFAYVWPVGLLARVILDLNEKIEGEENSQ